MKPHVVLGEKKTGKARAIEAARAIPPMLSNISLEPSPNERAKKEIVNRIWAGTITTLPAARAAYKVARKEHRLKAQAARSAKWAAWLEALSA